ncbi:DUF4399 domain-containing protein [Pseudoponticoccus marisrubri]|uniref:Rod shape-determining protein RodA n=1 Tax=Pseudoponticoccus marisrubri TaxID=1685382 RepID=A0A0W7WIN1_9RHOB|nr:DUF4399 domain-containing protein [Pseudoponticoccus marisrubri]KUF10460.1 rod shape-determining protein RodA [Pseudoponticoccus marisrubri]
MKPFLSALAIGALVSTAALAERTPAPEEASVYFIGLEDGATVSAPVTVRFGLSGMGVAPAGVEAENTGHHHVFVNRPPLGEAEGDEALMETGIPSDDNHRHFGGGQTEVTLDLPAGTHTLQLVMGDHFHVPHDPPIASEHITVTVE